MAKGKVDYDVNAATKAASKLAELAALDQSAFSIVGTTQGQISDSRAKAENLVRSFPFAPTSAVVWTRR